ncbi:MAG: hypothetical protein JRF50_14985 [Deltaproteobacteria bacterium]|nr:hypothetical protein [Deltaproteobacteria bacterium]
MKSIKIEDLISMENNREEVDVGGISVPVLKLKKLMEDGYAQLRAYKKNRTVSVWGKTCSACFTEQQLRGKKSRNQE